jgi:hypothetical protein
MDAMSTHSRLSESAIRRGQEESGFEVDEEELKTGDVGGDSPEVIAQRRTIRGVRRSGRANRRY